MGKVNPRLSSSKFSSEHSSSRRRFARIYARDRPFVRSVLLRLGVPARDVDDLVQEVFIVVWRNLERLVVDLDVRPWLYTVAANHARNYRRLRRCTKVDFALAALELAAVEFDPAWMIDAHRRFARLTRRLSEKVCRVFVPVALDGQTVKEVAQRLRIPCKTAEARIRIARRCVVMSGKTQVGHYSFGSSTVC